MLQQHLYDVFDSHLSFNFKGGIEPSERCKKVWGWDPTLFLALAQSHFISFFINTYLGYKSAIGTGHRLRAIMLYLDQFIDTTTTESVHAMK